MEPDDRPEPEVNGYVDVRHKQGEPCRVELTVKHYVDGAPWPETEFAFRVVDGVAEVHSVTPEGDTLYIKQNQPAREKAYEAVEELPSIEEVIRIND